MHTLRLTLYFVIGLLLGTWVVVANAETIAATSGVQNPQPFYRSNVLGSDAPANFYDPLAACKFYWSTTSIITADGSYGYRCKDASSVQVGYVTRFNGCLNEASHNIVTCGTAYTCPSGQNWTLSGSTCTRPDCVAPAVRDTSTGQCVAPTCPTTEQGSGWYSYPRSSTSGIGGQYCVNGCQVTLAWDLSQPTIYETSTKNWRRYSGYGDGVACSSGNGLPTSTANPPTEPPKQPPCAPGENVIGKASGGVNCVPSTTPDSDTPKVKKEEKKETFPDGSEKTVTTTETCNGTNACSTTTTTNVTNNSSGQPGLAGTPGTTTGTGASKDGTATDENPDICAANPNLQICKGGMSEETTQKKVLQELERFNNPGSTDDSELQTKAATAIANSDAVKNQDNELGQYVTGEKKNEGIEGQKGAWASAMSSGWIDPIELGGCAPIVSNFADKTWILDVCPTAAKISEIGAYAMWFLLAVGAFVMVTGGKQG